MFGGINWGDIRQKCRKGIFISCLKYEKRIDSPKYSG